MSYRNELGLNIELDRPQVETEEKEARYAICEDDKGPYIAEITPIDDRIKKFKKYGVLTQLFADGKKKVHLFKYISLFNGKNINEIVDENNIVPSTRLGVLDSSCFMEPGASVLYPDTKNIIKIRGQLKPYLISTSGDYFPFQHKSENGKRRYFLVYDGENKGVVEINESLFAMHLIQSDILSALNEVGSDSIVRALDCFKIVRRRSIVMRDKNKAINKYKKLSDALAIKK